MDLLNRLRKRLSIGKPKPDGALVVADNSVLPRLIDNAIRLKRSTRHKASGPTAVDAHEPNDDELAISGDNHVLPITMPAPQPGMLTINNADPPIRPETPVEVSIRTLFTGQHAARDEREVARPSQTMQSITISVRQTPDPRVRRCLGELFSEESNAVLLESVLDYVRSSDILRLTKVCRTVRLVVSGSARLQLRLKKLYYGISPDHVLHSKSATTAQQTAWLHEWQERLDRLRPHYSAATWPLSPSHVHSDGVMHLFEESSRLPTGDWPCVTTFTVRRTARPKELADSSSPVVLSITLEYERWNTPRAQISAENDLLVTYQRHRVISGATVRDRRAVWRLHFYKLTPSTARQADGDEHQAAHGHPSARLPFMDIVTEDLSSSDAELEIQMGPDGLLLFRCDMLDWDYHRLAYILDWRKGEVRGVMVTTGPIREPLSQLFIDARHLLTGVYSSESYEEKGEERVGASLWLSRIPVVGQRPQRLATLEAAEQGTPNDYQCFTIAHSDIPRICPEAAFLLPPFTGSGIAGIHHGRGMPIFAEETCLTALSTSPADSDSQESLLLFTLYGDMQYQEMVGESRPIQCSVAVPISILFALWRQEEVEEMARLTVQEYEQHRTANNANMDPVHEIYWHRWQAFAHVLFLNAVLPPVLHGSKLVIGLSERYEENPPLELEDAAIRVRIPIGDLSLIIRDFNPNRIALEAPNTSRRLGLPSSMAGLPSDPDSVPQHHDTFTPMPVRSTRIVRHGSIESTRSMFVEPLMWGGLAYTETVADLPHRVKTDLAEARHIRLTDVWQPRRLAIVSGWEFDGEDLTVCTHGMRLTLTFTPRPSCGDVCCVGDHMEPKSGIDGNWTTAQPQ